MMMRVKRRVVLVLINLLVFVVFAELAGLAVYYVENGALFYVHRKPYALIPETNEGRLTGEALHPFFGPTHRPGIPFDIPEGLRESESPSGPAGGADRLVTNNFGFVSPHQYPYARTRDEMLIGIFGGSVGVWFCQLGADRLVRELAAAPAIRGRTVVPLCFSHEGYKQPQQLQLLSYFLSIGQELDLVVNIDGFNEVALSALNNERGQDISMPSPAHLDPLVNLADSTTLTPEKLYSLAEINRTKERLNNLAGRIGTNMFASVNVVLERLYRSALDHYRQELGRFSNLPSNPPSASIVQVTPPVRPRDAAAVFGDAARSWIAASTLMHQMLAARRVPYVHVLQPNQYHSRRRFSAGEAGVALNEASPFKRSAEQGYPVLLAAAEAPAFRAQVNFFNGVGVLDDEPAAVYVDDCCHYTRAGNLRLAEAIAAHILKTVTFTR
jgi:hypothetical protein